MIQYHTADINFIFKSKRKTSAWIKKTIENEGFCLNDLNYIFCSDEYLLQVNLEYLQHDTLTDIITFDNSEEDNLVEGDVFISIDRVKENAQLFGITFENELCRVLVHGVLHLCGHGDKTSEQKANMRKLESYYLSQLEN